MFEMRMKSWHLFAIHYQFILSLLRLNQFSIWNETHMKQISKPKTRDSYLSIDSIVVIGLMCSQSTLSNQLIFGMTPWSKTEKFCVAMACSQKQIPNKINEKKIRDFFLNSHSE